jgi:hypothetical protein
MGRPPLVTVSRHGDVEVFASLERAERYTERYDADDLCLVVDGDGLRYSAEVRDRRVRFVADPETDATQVRAELLGVIGGFDQADASLSDLFERLIAIYGYSR